MLLDYLRPARCTAQSETEALRRASELHAVSTLEVGREARKTQARVSDLRVIADAAERRAAQRNARIDTLNKLLDRER